MAITADLNGKNYTLGRGRVIFERFDENAVIDESTVGDGFKYLGNTPAFSTSGSADNLDHFDSDSGVKVKDDSVQLTMDRSGKFESDNIDIYNLALFFGGDQSVLAVGASAALTQNFTIKKGRIYQLGESPSNPSGHRKTTITTVKIGATLIDPANYQHDGDLGQLLVLPTAADLDDGDEITVTYAVAASSREVVISGSKSIYGRIKFISDNPKGVNRDYYYPYVKIAPDGDYAVKGDDWQKVGFTFEILKRGNLEAVYIDARAA